MRVLSRSGRLSAAYWLLLADTLALAGLYVAFDFRSIVLYLEPSSSHDLYIKFTSPFVPITHTSYPDGLILRFTLP